MTIIYQLEVAADVTIGTVITNTANANNGEGAIYELGPATVTVTTDKYTAFLPVVMRNHQ